MSVNEEGPIGISKTIKENPVTAEINEIGQTVQSITMINEKLGSIICKVEGSDSVPDEQPICPPRPEEGILPELTAIKVYLGDLLAYNSNLVDRLKSLL